MTYEEKKQELLAHPVTHDFLKKAIELFDNKDALDAFYGIKILLELHLLRLHEQNIYPSRSF